MLAGENMGLNQSMLGDGYKITPRVPDHLLTLTKIENTVITCRVCRGVKIVTIKHVSGRMDFQPCPCCHGSGIMDSKLIWSRE